MTRKTETAANEVQLNLHYQHGTGHLAPYFDGLAEGKAVASHCPCCGKSWFPPRAICPDDRRQTQWRGISGDGVVVSVTSTRTRLPLTKAADDYRFVLVTLQDAENSVFGRMQSTTTDVCVGTRVTLVAPLGELGHPAQAAQFRPRGD